MKTFDVSSVCNVLMDILLEVSEADLDSFRLEKGKMHLVDRKHQREILESLHKHEGKVELGGSSLNTIKALALLGCQVSFSGMVGDDHYASLVRKAMDAVGIDAHLQEHGEEETGKSLILVTPDGERTMNTYLGASSLYHGTDLLYESMSRSRFFHFSGYQWSSDSQKEVALRAIDLVHKNSGIVSFDLADPLVVEANRSEFLELLDSRVDLFFGNREETNSLFQGSSCEKFLSKTQNKNLIAAVKLDEDGAIIYHKEEKIIVPPVVTDVVDTTGAGDMFAAGFLCGMVHGLGLPACGRLATILASDVIDHFGATLSEKALQFVSSELSRLRSLHGSLG